MRVGFAGTPEFAARALAALHEGGYTIPLVLTQPDRPSGRGMIATALPVKRYAQAHALPLAQPSSLRNADVQAELRAITLDVLVVAAYGLILPQAVLDWPRHGCLNIHASLLPRWRGAAPIARAIEAGDRESGITIMQMDAGLDTGPIVTAESLPVAPRETAGGLHDRLAYVGARLIVDAIERLARHGVLESRPQPAEGVTYAAKIERADRAVDWASSAEAIDRKVRALFPAPGALAAWQGMQVRIVEAEPVDSGSGAGATAAGRFATASRVHGPVPGEVVAVSSAGIDVGCGHGSVLRLTTVQPASGRSMSAGAFAAGRGVALGGRFTSVPGERSASAPGATGRAP
ncbi:MAG TPA: methionyl-tRNA formyltransferase [Casimicrobiaceae bacterium]|nr:methionyl-tRNA formyltransferase [Casimicrobiaceae bacterium]